MKSKYAIIGLGNPGSQYEYTRHNIGALFLYFLARKYGDGVFVTHSSLQALTSTIRIYDKDILLLFPQTYMNCSGRSLSSLLKYSPQCSYIVVADDKDLPFLHARFRAQGSSGGHNGLKDIARIVGQEFPRIKLGVANDSIRTTDTADFVLSSFTPDEKMQLESVYIQGEKLFLDWFTSLVSQRDKK